MNTLTSIQHCNRSIRGYTRLLIFFAIALLFSGCGPVQTKEPTTTLTPTTPPTATPVPGPQPGHYKSEEKYDDHGNLVLIEFDIVNLGELENFVGVVRSDIGTCRFEIKAVQLDGEDEFDLDLAEFNIDEASGLVGEITGQFTEGEGFDGTLQITQCGRMFTLNWFNLEWVSLLVATTE